jgi:hypothetical protein
MRAPSDITRFEYPAVGRCIYCGRTAPPLREEHIIAYALAGTTTLPDASCDDCGTITGRVEQQCCNVSINHLRFPMKFPSRKGKGKHRLLPLIGTDASGKLIRLHTEVADNPVGLALPVLDMPRILLGMPDFPLDRMNIQVWRYGPPQERIAEMARKHGLKSVAANVDAPAMARMIAKIAHSFAVAEFGVDTFTPLLLNVILTDGANWPHLVGGTDEPIEKADQKNLMHSLDAGIVRLATGSYLVVKVRLFTRFNAPTYQAVVGSLSPDQDAGAEASIPRSISAKQRR